MVTKLRIRAAVPGQLVINDLASPVTESVPELELESQAWDFLTIQMYRYRSTQYGSNICMLPQHAASRTLIRLIVFQFHLTSFR